MDAWKSLLYQRYITSGQAAQGIDINSGLAVNNYPYFKQLIKRHISSDRAIKLADLACGYGALIFVLRTLGYSNIEGIDCSKEQIDLAHSLGINEAKLGTVQDFLAVRTNTFDVIVMIDILEHFSKQELFDTLNMVYKSLNFTGKLIIHVPNGAGLFGMRIRYGDLTHELCFTPTSIRQALHAQGFETVTVYEDKPIIHGVKSLIRHILWVILTLPIRLLLIAETGSLHHILSQNMTVTATKSTTNNTGT